MNKTIIPLCLGLLLSFKTSAIDNSTKVDLKEVGYLSGLNHATSSNTPQPATMMTAPALNEEVNFLKELSVYGLIILVYSLYCYKTSQ